MSAIFNSFFTSVANTVSTSIGVESGEPQNGSCRICQNWKQPKGIDWCHFQFQFHTSHMWWITAGCLLVQGRWSHLKTTTWVLVDIWHSGTSHSKSILGNFQHQYLPELLSYCVQLLCDGEKCFAVMCMEAGFCQIQSQLH